jgi:hypothetical protein
MKATPCSSPLEELIKDVPEGFALVFDEATETTTIVSREQLPYDNWGEEELFPIEKEKA